MKTYSLHNPFQSFQNTGEATEKADTRTPEQKKYDNFVAKGQKLMEKPKAGGGPGRISVQHSKNRMTVWERIKVLTENEPNILYQNWGEHLDGAGLVTGILNIDGRDVALYGHDFTVRAGSMDATNGNKLARLIYMAGEQGIPLIGMNDSAGAFVPAGVGGLDGYSEAFCALRKISGLVPSIMLMFGYNAGGGSYLPRQGSFMVQARDTFFGLTGPAVVKQALGEDVTADELGGPQVHSRSGVVDLVGNDETDALYKALELLRYLPDNNHSLAPHVPTSDPITRFNQEEVLLFRKYFGTPITGFNTPFEITLYIQQLVDHGQYIELQPRKARNLITAFGRVGGHVVGFMANNSAVESGNIDIAAAQKGKRFVRFCNLYNIPVVFIEDVTGFQPGKEMESGGIVQEGRELLDAIIDLRTPRLTMIVRNAYGGAYATWNSYHVGADMVFALPSARIAVMGPAGREFVYKDEYKKIMATYKKASATDETGAAAERDAALAELTARYEEELMNPNEALKLGSVSRIVLPGQSRQVLAENLGFYLRHYQARPMEGPQRE